MLGTRASSSEKNMMKSPSDFERAKFIILAHAKLSTSFEIADSFVMKGFPQLLGLRLLIRHSK